MNVARRRNKLNFVDPETVKLEARVMLRAAATAGETDQEALAPVVTADETSTTAQGELDGTVSIDDTLDQENGASEAEVAAFETELEAAIEAALSGEFQSDGLDRSGASVEELEFELRDAIVETLNGVLFEDAESLSFGQGAIAGIRAELVNRGNPQASLAAFDEAVSEFAGATLRSSFRLSDDVTPDFSELAVFNPEGAFSLRVENNTNPNLPNGLAARINEVIAEAITFNGQVQVSVGDLSLGGVPQLGGIETDRASEEIVRGLLNNDIDSLTQGQNRFSSVRQELIDNGNATDDELSEFDFAFIRLVQEVAVAEVGLGIFASTNDARTAVRTAVDEALVSNEAFSNDIRPYDSVTFVGDNGRPPALIYVVESATDTGDGRGGIIHQRSVGNVIERQLQEAGQSYQLEGLEYEAGLRGNAPSRTNAIRRATEAGAQYLNLSNAFILDVQIYTDVLRQLSDVGSPLVEGIDLSEPVSQANFSQFRPVLREVLLNIGAVNETIELSEQEFFELDQAFRTIMALEQAAAAGVQVFVSAPNDNTQIPPDFLADDQGLEGSITFVGNIGTLESLQSNDFETDFDRLSRFENGGVIPGQSGAQFYRGDSIDVYAPGVAPVAYTVGFGASYSTPDALVNTVLGRFDPRADANSGETDERRPRRENVDRRRPRVDRRRPRPAV